MLIYVKDLIGRASTYEVEVCETVDSLKCKIQDKLGVPPDGQRLIFAGNQFDDGKTLYEYGVKKHSVIHLVFRLTGGGYPRHFVDLENKDALLKIEFTYSGGEAWSSVSSGLNIEGKCTYLSCRAYGKRVICQKNYGTFDITADSSDCPKCGCTIEAITCGFSDCEWSYKGRKKGSEDNITSEWHISGDEYERFREAGNMTDWEVLIIEAKLSPLPRPQCAICLRDMVFGEEVQRLAILACECRFHSHCVADWKTRETHCPTCRSEMHKPESPTTSKFGNGEICSAEVFRESPTASVGFREMGSLEDRPRKRNRFRGLFLC